MADKIYELFQEHKDGPLKDEFINKAFDIMISNEEELLPYIKDFQIRNFSEKLLGVYSNENRSIHINREVIEKQIINPQLLTLHILKHELEHARNLKKLYDGKKDLESTLIYYSLRAYAMDHGLDYEPNLDNLCAKYLYYDTKLCYETDPGERIADIKACKYIVNLLKNQNNTDELLIARGMLYYAYTRGYKDNGYYLDPPVYEFLLRTGMFHDHYWLKNRVEKKDYCFDTRITYGLPVTYSEYDKGVMNKVKLYKNEWVVNKDRSNYE